jgi:tetratricopeptide (TPR) repeat protein
VEAPRESEPKALAAAAKAVALDDSSAEAHNSVAFIKLNYDWDWVQSEREFKRSIELNKGWANEHHWYAHHLMSSRRIPEAEAESLRALELDPLSAIMNTHLGWHYYFARQYDKSLEQLRKTLELVPNYGLALWYSGWAYEQKGLYSDALRDLQRAKELLKTSAWMPILAICTPFQATGPAPSASFAISRSCPRRNTSMRLKSP